jgi:hypothetical protein
MSIMRLWLSLTEPQLLVLALWPDLRGSHEKDSHVTQSIGFGLGYNAGGPVIFDSNSLASSQATQLAKEQASVAAAAFAGAIVANGLIDENHDCLGSFGDVQVAFAAYFFF